MTSLLAQVFNYFNHAVEVNINNSLKFTLIQFHGSMQNPNFYNCLKNFGWVHWCEEWLVWLWSIALTEHLVCVDVVCLLFWLFYFAVSVAWVYDMPPQTTKRASRMLWLPEIQLWILLFCLWLIESIFLPVVGIVFYIIWVFVTWDLNVNFLSNVMPK